MEDMQHSLAFVYCLPVFIVWNPIETRILQLGMSTAEMDTCIVKPGL